MADLGKQRALLGFENVLAMVLQVGLLFSSKRANVSIGREPPCVSNGWQRSCVPAVFDEAGIEDT